MAIHPIKQAAEQVFVRLRRICWPSPLGDDFPGHVTRHEMRGGADTLNRSARDCLEVLVIRFEHLEFDARGSGIQREYSIHANNK